MNARLATALAACLVAACAAPNTTPDTASSAHIPLASGVDKANIDASVRVQDDLYGHVDGGWVKKVEIPADKAGYGVFIKLRDDTLAQLHGIIDGLEGNSAGLADPDARRIRDLYASFMDEARLESLGLKPLAGEFARIDAVKTKAEIPELIAHLNAIGVAAPYRPRIHQDARDSTRYIVDLGQGGLGLPDRDYYLKDDDARLKGMRDKYREHVAKMLAMAGDSAGAAEAGQILVIETGLARVQWTRVENRDPVKRYNKVAVTKLPDLAPGYDWKRYFVAANVDGKVTDVIVSQPSYMTGFAKLLDEQPLEAWKAYFRWRVLDSFSPYLSRPYVDENFAFDGGVVRGIPENRPRWQRGVTLVDEAIGEGLGKLYVEQYFPPEKKARMDALVKNLLAAYRQSIDQLDWMGPETKHQAQAKLAAFSPKIGYPTQWRDYSKLAIDPADLVGNVMRAEKFDYDRNLAKLGGPIDRGEWHMNPQTVNAYYNPELNEIVFPAAILQPPFFDANADDAVNYGGIGAVIGHEISHGFDDSGSQYDGTGNLRDWWTKEDHKEFSAKTNALVAQYDAYEPVPGYHVNGKLTLGENIADNSGLAIAWKAYQLSLNGKPAPVIDGYTGAQRFFMGWAQVWPEKRREQESIRLLKIDPHSPGRFRANGAAVNQSAYYDAFGVKPGDGMYVAPDKRVSIW
jgi:predicted metalloendopeptidase